PEYATSLSNLALLCAATDHAEDAFALMQQAAIIDDRILSQAFAIGSDRARMAFLRTLQTQLYVNLSLVWQAMPHTPAVMRAGLDLVLRRKAIGAEALAAQRDAILGGQYPDLAPILHELTTLRAQIAQQTLAGPDPDNPAAYRQRLATWTTQQERLEADLARRIPELRLERQLRLADSHEVAQALPPDAALVE